MKDVLNGITRFLRGFTRPSKAANTRSLRERGETLESIRIRDATPHDIPALAELHVKTWTDTYRPVANPPTYQIRERQWREQFAKNDGSWVCLVAENRAGELIGFATVAIMRRYGWRDLQQLASICPKTRAD